MAVTFIKNPILVNTCSFFYFKISLSIVSTEQLGNFTNPVLTAGKATMFIKLFTYLLPCWVLLEYHYRDGLF